ncbi:hypothetical protein SB00610_04119 [Klebsiella quasipneumoniae subsp. similipneumoniae]|nr:hypothetical protein SB00610_04119 [Klebsiella quasipneumoniae subsp. similipneumoniae]
MPLKFIASWLGCISNGIKLPSISTPLNCIWPNSCGLFTLPPRRRRALSLPSAFSPRAKIGLIIASEKLLILTLPPRLRRPCGSVTCTCPSSWPLLVRRISQPSSARLLCRSALRFSVSNATGSGASLTTWVTLTLRPLRVTLPCGSPSLVVSQLTSALPVKTPLAWVASGINGLSIARSKRLRFTRARPLAPASMVSGTQSSAFGLVQQCGPMLIFCSWLR